MEDAIVDVDGVADVLLDTEDVAVALVVVVALAVRLDVATTEDVTLDVRLPLVDDVDDADPERLTELDIVVVNVTLILADIDNDGVKLVLPVKLLDELLVVEGKHFHSRCL